jgi:anti-sigma B factor antagonist
MPAPLRITERSTGDIVVLHLDGHLVFDEGDRFLRERVTALVNAGSRFLLIDLHDVSYVDSGGIGALVEMYMHVMRAGGRLLLLRPSYCAERVLHITHLSSAFQVFGDEAAAVRSLSAPLAAGQMSG